MIPDAKNPDYGPDYYSHVFGRLWDDNYWISALLDTGTIGPEEEDKKGDKGGKGGKGK